MPEKNDWLFDIIWDLSDKAYDANMPVLAEKLEEAMDTYLSETLGCRVGSNQGKFRRHRPDRGQQKRDAGKRAKLGKEIAAILANAGARAATVRPQGRGNQSL